MDYETIKFIAKDLGFTLDKITPLLVLVFLVIWLINRRMKPIEDLARRIESFIIRLCGVIQTGGDLTKMKLYNAESPLKILPKGMEIIQEMGFKKAIDDNLNFLIKFIDGLKPKTALDVEELSIGTISYLMKDATQTIFKEVENFIYIKPEYKNAEYFKVAGLYLRDKYLEKNPKLLPPKEKKVNLNV